MIAPIEEDEDEMPAKTAARRKMFRLEQERKRLNEEIWKLKQIVEAE